MDPLVAGLHHVGERIVLSPGIELDSVAFIDDLTCLAARSSIQAKCDYISTWSEYFSVKVNVAKSDLLLVAPSQCEYKAVTVHLKGIKEGKEGMHDLTTKDQGTVKLLGYKISPQLDWTDQVNAVTKFVCYTAYLFIVNALPLQLAVAYLNTIFNPKLSYFTACVPISSAISRSWNITLTNALKKLFISPFSRRCLCSPQAMAAATGWVLPSTIVQISMVSTTFSRITSPSLAGSIERLCWDSKYDVRLGLFCRTIQKSTIATDHAVHFSRSKIILHGLRRGSIPMFPWR